MNFKDSFKEAVTEYFSTLIAGVKKVLINTTKLLLIIMALTLLSGSVYLVVNKFVQLKQEANELVSQEIKKTELEIEKLKEETDHNRAYVEAVMKELDYAAAQKIAKEKSEKSEKRNQEKLKAEKKKTKGLICYIKRSPNKMGNDFLTAQYPKVINKRFYLIISSNSKVEYIEWDEYNFPRILSTNDKSNKELELVITGTFSYLIRLSPDQFIGSSIKLNKVDLTFTTSGGGGRGVRYQGDCSLYNPESIRAMVQKEQDMLKSKKKL